MDRLDFEYSLLANDAYDSPPPLLDMHSGATRFLYTAARIMEKNSKEISEYREEREKRLRALRINIRKYSWEDLYDYPAVYGDGFFARLYGNRITRATAIAYRGTVPTKLDNIMADISLTFRIPFNFQLKAMQFYQEALRILAQFKKYYWSKPSLTGHSLGGYLAQFVSITQGGGKIPTYSFNSPKVGDAMLPKGCKIDPHNKYIKIINFDNVNDKIHKIGRLVGQQRLLPGNPRCTPGYKEKQILSQKYLFGGISTLINTPINYFKCCVEEHQMEPMIKRIEISTDNRLIRRPS